MKKWGRLPEEDEDTFVKPIEGTDVTLIKWSGHVEKNISNR